MSDIFNDDFTAELKNYFLQNLILEIADVIDLVDDSLWTRIRVETIKQAKDVWAVDARTNDFVHLAEWLENIEMKVAPFQKAFEFKKYLSVLKDYVNALLTEKSDSADLAAKFVALAESLREILFLHCRYGSQDFAVPLLNIVEIINSRPLHSLPQKKDTLLGVLAFRGQVIPVIDFENHGFIRAESESFCYIICENGGNHFCLQITETDDVVKIKESELQNTENQKSFFNVTFVTKFFVQGKKNIMVLDLDKLVAS